MLHLSWIGFVKLHSFTRNSWCSCRPRKKIDWEEASKELIEMFPDATERCLIESKLMDLPVERRVEYFQDTAAEANKVSLQCLAGIFDMSKLHNRSGMSFSTVIKLFM